MWNWVKAAAEDDRLWLRIVGIFAGVGFTLALIGLVIHHDNSLHLTKLADIVSVSAGVGILTATVLEVVGMVLSSLIRDAFRSQGVKQGTQSAIERLKAQLDADGIPYRIESDGFIRVLGKPQPNQDQE